MAPLNDLQITQKEILRYVIEIRQAYNVIPFGQNLLLKVVLQFSGLLNFHDSLPTGLQRLLCSKCQNAYVFIMERKNKSLIYWIQHHEEIRRRMVSFLSSYKKPYFMTGSEIASWCDEVFSKIKTVIPRYTRSRGEYSLERQSCLDGLYELARLAQYCDDRARLLEYYAYLIKLCQKYSLSPSSFVIPCPAISNREPVETGASALVHHGYHGNREVAIKKFRLYARTMASVKSRFLKESFVLQILQHPNIVPFIGVVNEPSRLCIISPWMKNGDIINFLKTSAKPLAYRKELIEQIADGLHFLSEYNIVHGDLKGGNVLINDEEKACISDFGIASIKEHVESPPSTPLRPEEERILTLRCEEALKYGGMSRTLASSLSSRISSFSGAGTYRWMSPERLMPENFGLARASATVESDVFSYAMLTYEVYTGNVPFHTDTHQIAMLNTIVGRRPPRPPNMNDNIWAIVQECWSPEPSQRPTIWNIYNRLARMP